MTEKPEKRILTREQFKEIYNAGRDGQYIRYTELPLAPDLEAIKAEITKAIDGWKQSIQLPFDGSVRDCQESIIFDLENMLERIKNLSLLESHNPPGGDKS